MSTALKEKETALPAAMLADFEADGADAGFENADKDSFAIPMLKVLQSMSPQCVEGKPEYDREARPGMLLNTVTEEKLDGEEGREVIPVFYTRKFIEWESPKPNSGLVAIHDVKTGLKLLETCTRDDKNNEVLPNGHCLVDVREYCLLDVTDSTIGSPVMVGMSKSQLKVSKRWITTMDGIKLKGKDGIFTAPIYSHRYRMTTVSETNNDGDVYKNWKVQLIGPVEDAEQYAAAKAFREALASGKAKADHNQMAEGASSVDDDDTPF